MRAFQLLHRATKIRFVRELEGSDLDYQKNYTIKNYNKKSTILHMHSI